MTPISVLVDITASSDKSGVGRWINGFCRYLESRGVDFQRTSAVAWGDSSKGIFSALARNRLIRDLLYYAVALPRISSRFQRVVILDNIGRLTFPLPPAARPFYLIHDLIPLEMTSGQVGARMGWLLGLRWFLSSRLYRWRLSRVMFAPGARFGYISRATEHAAFEAFGEPARRGEYIGPMMIRVGVAADAPDREVPPLASGKRYVLALGTGDPKKGLESLLTAWRQAGVSNNLQLVLFGSSWKDKGRAWIEKRIRELAINNVIHVGPVSEAALAALYKNASAFVFPSFFEGLGLPPAEFCMEGAGELILRDIPVLREIYGDVAHFFTSDDELAALLQAVAADRLDPVLPPESRREKLAARLDPAATFERLWQAIQSHGQP